MIMNAREYLKFKEMGIDPFSKGAIAGALGIDLDEVFDLDKKEQNIFEEINQRYRAPWEICDEYDLDLGDLSYFSDPTPSFHFGRMMLLKGNTRRIAIYEVGTTVFLSWSGRRSETDEWAEFWSHKFSSTTEAFSEAHKKLKATYNMEIIELLPGFHVINRLYKPQLINKKD